MIASHHKWIIRAVLAGRRRLTFNDYWNGLTFTAEQLQEMSHAPDDWEDMWVGYTIGHMEATSYLHFLKGYIPSQDPTMHSSRLGRLFKNNVLDLKKLHMSDRIKKAFQEMGYPVTSSLKEAAFPPAEDFCKYILKSDDWTVEERISFYLHYVQDLEVPHHQSGFCFANHTDLEEFAGEFILEMDPDRKELSKVMNEMSTFNVQPNWEFFAASMTLGAFELTQSFLIGATTDW